MEINHQERWITLSLCQDPFPSEAILAGKDYNGDPIYVGRAHHNNELLPAKIIYKKGVKILKGFILTDDGEEIPKCLCEVLCGDFEEKEEKHNLSLKVSNLSFIGKKFTKLFDVSISLNYRWEFANNGFVPSNAIIGGYTNNKEIIYIGRIEYKKCLILGKIIPSKCLLFISYKGKELSFNNYEVLVRNK